MTVAVLANRARPPSRRASTVRPALQMFNPSLIWLPFGKRHPADITFPLAPTFESHGIDFVQP
jgi:hypothetical protein